MWARPRLTFNGCQRYFQERRKRLLLSQVLQLQEEEPLCQLVSSKGEKVKKLVTVLATSTPVTVAREKLVEDDKNLRSNLIWVLCIRYPINFREKSVSALFNSNSEFNAVYPTFAKKLGFPIRPIDVRAQKIDGTTLETFGIVVAAFSVTNKDNQVRFFKKTFLVANVSPKVVFGISFLTLSTANVDFLGRKLR